MKNRPIALLTDFGHKDPFVGIMKGVILGINPDANLIDLCHETEPGDISQASFALAMAFKYLPEEAVCLIVVDPGVGTDRRSIAAEIGGRVFVGPDNGLLTWVASKEKIGKTVILSNTDYQLPERSDTFHGRDVFAPVAAYLSKGVDISELGPSVDGMVTFELPEVFTGDSSLQGEVAYIDRFGNLITNIDQSGYKVWSRGSGDMAVHIASAEIRGIHRTFSEIPHLHPAAIFGSSGMLEIVVNGGSAEYSLGASVGSKVLILKLG